MVRTNSTMLPLGTFLPEFDLVNVLAGKQASQNDLHGLERIRNDLLLPKPLLVMVICAHCPFVKHIEIGLSALEKDYGSSTQILAVSSNSVITHPEDSSENLVDQSKKNGWQFPYLFDADQSFSKALMAACTPDFFLFSYEPNKQFQLQYRGQLDESRPGNTIPVSGRDLREALDAVLDGKKVIFDQKPSIGCNIKWHPGNEPIWFG